MSWMTSPMQHRKGHRMRAAAGQATWLGVSAASRRKGRREGGRLLAKGESGWEVGGAARCNGFEALGVLPRRLVTCGAPAVSQGLRILGEYTMVCSYVDNVKPKISSF